MIIKWTYNSFSIFLVQILVEKEAKQSENLSRFQVQNQNLNVVTAVLRFKGYININIPFQVQRLFKICDTKTHITTKIRFSSFDAFWRAERKTICNSFVRKCQDRTPNRKYQVRKFYWSKRSLLMWCLISSLSLSLLCLFCFPQTTDNHPAQCSLNVRLY